MYECLEIKKYVFIDFYLYFNIIFSFVDLKKKKL